MKKYDERYQNSKDPDRYYRMHRDQLTLCWGAKTLLKNMGIDPEKIDLSEIEKHFNQMASDKDRIYIEFRSMEEE